VVNNASVFVGLEGIIDFSKETQRLEKEIAKLAMELTKIGKKLANEGFLNKAPADVIEKVREKHLQMPILMLTARVDAEHRVRGLEIGADDYMTKPFHLRELLLRVQGMLRRKQWYKDSVISTPVYIFGENKIDFEKLKCETKKGEIQLTAHEAMLLRYFIENKGRALSRKELMEQIWQVHSELETRTVDNFIVRLRKYFEADPAHPVFFKSIRGIGYIFQD